MLPISLICDGSFHRDTGRMECSFAVYYGSVHCGLRLTHVKRAQIPLCTDKKQPSSTRAEYIAVLTGMSWIRDNGLNKVPWIFVMSDCEAVHRMKLPENVTVEHYPSEEMKRGIIGH